MTTDIKELARSLRAKTWESGGWGEDDEPHKAADALEAMAGEVDAYESARVTWAEAMRAWINRATVAEAERDKWHVKSNEQEDRADMAIAERDRLKAELKTASQLLHDTAVRKSRLKAALLEIKADPIIAVAVAERALKGEAS